VDGQDGGAGQKLESFSAAVAYSLEFSNCARTAMMSGVSAVRVGVLF
jgi:hypothetical protein